MVNRLPLNLNGFLPPENGDRGHINILAIFDNKCLQSESAIL